MRLLILTLILSTSCGSRAQPSKPCPVPIPEPIRVVPSSPHCLTQEPQGVDAVIDEIVALPRGAALPREQANRLLRAYNEQRKYSARAWRLCGKTPSQ